MNGDTQRETVSPSRWLLGNAQRILLELSTIFYFFARNAAIPLIQQYIYHLVGRKYNLTGVLAAAAAATRPSDQSDITRPTSAPGGGGQSEIIGYPTDDGLELVADGETTISPAADAAATVGIIVIGNCLNEVIAMRNRI